MSREATLAARWLNEPQPISNQLVGWGFYTARGGMDRGDLCFRPQVVGVVEIWSDFSSGDKIYPPQVRRDLDLGQRGDSRRALAP